MRRKEQDNTMRGNIRRKVSHFPLNQVHEGVDEPLIQGPAIDQAPADLLIEGMVGREAGQMFGQRVEAAACRAARIMRILGEGDHAPHSVPKRRDSRESRNQAQVLEQCETEDRPEDTKEHVVGGNKVPH